MSRRDGILLAMGFFEKIVGWVCSVFLPSSRRGRQERIETRLRRALNSYAAGRYGEAERGFRESIGIAEEFGDESLELAGCLSRLGDIHQSTGNYADAEPLLTRSLTIRQKKFGAESPEICAGLNDLALLHYTQGKYEAGEKLFQRLLAILENRREPEDRELAVCLDNYAALLRKLQREEESARLQERAKKIRAKAKATAGSPSESAP